MVLKERDITYKTNKEMLDKSLSELQERRLEILRLQTRLTESEFSASRAKELQKQVQELSAETSQLQSSIADFAKRPFVKDTEGQLNYVKKLQTLELEQQQLQKEHEELLEETERTVYDNGQLAKETEEVKGQLTKANAEVEQFKIGFSADTAGRLLAAKNSEEFRGVMDNLVREGGMPQWANVNFLPSRPNKEDPNDPQFLLHEIERLKLERGQLAAELQKAQSLQDAKGRTDEAKLGLENKLNDLERRIEQPVSKPMADIPGIPESIYRKGMLTPGRDLDALTEFSVESHVSELPPKSNILDLLVIDCMYYDKMLEEVVNLSGAEISQLNTLVEVSFYNHDLRYSEAKPGLAPKYALQIAFQVDVEDALLKHLHEGEIEIVCLYSHEGAPKAIGKALIPLKELVDKTLNTMPNMRGATVSKAVNVIGLGESGTEQRIIGQLRYKMRMRNEMVQELKEFKARTEYKPAIRSGIDSFAMPSEVRSYTIRIVNCRGLKTKEASRVLAPFVYYGFYKYWHTTKTMGGSEPEFDEVRSFDVTMSQSFLEYLKTASLELVIFDDKRSMASRPKEGPPLGDIIGRAQAKLSELLEQNERKFIEPIYEFEGENMVGTIEVHIAWNSKRASELR